jgi:hypothetical protein
MVRKPATKKDSSKKNDRSIPASVRQEVLIEAGYRCGIPTCRTTLTIELHHIDHVASGGPNTTENLIALCPNCHSKYHLKIIPVEAIRVYKGMLVSLNEGINKEAKDILLLLSLPFETRPAMYSADAILKFAPLIVSGLVRIQLGIPDFRLGRGYAEHHWVGLTPKGEALIAAWKAGDLKALAAAQTMSPADPQAAPAPAPGDLPPDPLP